MIHALYQDLRYAARTLAKSRGFTIAAIVTLALGVGANIAIFSVVYGVLLRPLPYRDAGRLVLVRTEADYTGAHRPVPVYLGSSEFDDWRRAGGAVFAPAFYSPDVQALSTESTGSEVLDVGVVSNEFFSTLGGPLAAGRPLERDDDVLPRAVISTRLARRLFGDTASAIGKQIVLTSNSYTIVGVAASSFQFPDARIDAWLPAGFVRSVNTRCCGFRTLARLSANASVEHARAAADAIVQQPTSGARPAGSPRTIVVTVPDDIVAATRPALLVLFASVLVVLVVACSNLINLLLARNAARDHDFAVRRALGASAGQLARHLFVENALLAIAGTSGGLLVAQASLAALSRAAADAVPRIDAIHIDPPALAFALLLAALATIGTGLVPAVRAVSIADIRARSGNASVPAASRRLQRTMCVVQVALAMTLVIGATLLAASFAYSRPTWRVDRPRPDGVDEHGVRRTAD